MVVCDLPVANIGVPLNEGEGEAHNIPCPIHVLTCLHVLQSTLTKDINVDRFI